MNQTERLRENTRQLEFHLANINQSDCCLSIAGAQCFALVEIGRAPGISVKELANVLRLDKSGVSRTVEELVLKNLVERRPSVSDRRYVVLSLTPAGIERFEEIENNMNEKFRKILNKIPSDKRKQVIESLELYNTALSKL